MNFKTLELGEGLDAHNFQDNPVFIEENGKLVGMVKRSAFNNLYPTLTDRGEFDNFPQTLRLSDVVIYLESVGYKAVIQFSNNANNIREALGWYQEQAESLARYTNDRNTTAQTAVLVSLSLDAGNRAKAALGLSQQLPSERNGNGGKSL